MIGLGANERSTRSGRAATRHRSTRSPQRSTRGSRPSRTRRSRTVNEQAVDKANETVKAFGEKGFKALDVNELGETLQRAFDATLDALDLQVRPGRVRREHRRAPWRSSTRPRRRSGNGSPPRGAPPSCCGSCSRWSRIAPPSSTSSPANATGRKASTSSPRPRTRSKRRPTRSGRQPSGTRRQRRRARRPGRPPPRRCRRRQFRAIGLAPGGGEIIPGVENLQETARAARRRAWSARTSRRNSLNRLAGVRKVLAGGFGKVTEETRARRSATCSRRSAARSTRKPAKAVPDQDHRR